MDIQLVKSSVVFNEEFHTYYAKDGSRLSGITSLIHQVLQLGVYEEASEFVKEVAIPRAAEYGTCVHKSIEFYDCTGIRNTLFSGKFGDWDVSRELDNYILHQKGYQPVANEYTVSDEVRYASQIDNVWQKVETEGIWLIDTKTNNVDYYPGGVDGLKEYLSWQLSCYAYLFERQNPGLTVEGLACNWLRKDKAEFWHIERKCDAEVEKLLSTPFTIEDGRIVYLSSMPVEKPKQDCLLASEKVDNITKLLHLQKEVDEKIGEMKDFLIEQMSINGVKSLDVGTFKVSLTEAGVSTTFDSARFKKENPDLYNQYMKETQRKASIRITLR